MHQDTRKPDGVHSDHAPLVMPGTTLRQQVSSVCAERHVAAMVVDVVARSFGVTPGALRSRRRGVAEVALARQIAMYLLHCCCELSLTEAGIIFRRDRTTVAHGCKRVEDMREDARFDWRIDRIERSVRIFRKSVLMREAA